MWMGNNRSSIQNEQNGNDNLLIKAIRHSHSVRNQCFVYFLWIYCPYFNKLYRNSERNDNIGPAVGFIRNGSLHVHICKRTIPVCIHALYSFNHCFCTFTILGFIQNQTKKTEKKKRKDTEKIITETMTVN